MRLRVLLVAFFAAQLALGGDTQRLFVRVVDVECQPIPGVSVAFVRAGDPPSHPVTTGVTDSKGYAFFDASPDIQYEISAWQRGFLSSRVGPIRVTSSRPSKPVLLVLNLEPKQ
jgi:hypothetical protein